MRHFWVFRARARQSWSPSSAAGLARDGKDGKNAPTEAIGRIIDCGQEAKMEILAGRWCDLPHLRDSARTARPVRQPWPLWVACGFRFLRQFDRSGIL